jgi:C4-dicarboxylate-specific signal transduction histidine kinase
MAMKRQEVAFFGKISASMTHDIRNVLAIIRESSGLMLDLLGLCEEGAFPYQQKFHGLLTAIQDQVNRGVELATHFNRFAHSMDHAVMEVDGNEVVRQMTYLMQRFARLRKVQLIASVAERPVAFRTDAFALHRIMGECVSFLLQRAADGDTITLAVGQCEGGAEFRILAPRAGLPAESASAAVPEELREVMEYLQSQGGSLQRVTVPDGTGIALVVPSSPLLSP